jgi:peptide subunit release factor 1 (eRF1)
VAVITEAAIRELAGIKGERAPITSVYLDVDGRRLQRHQDYEHELDTMLRAAKNRANGHASVHDDLRKIEQYVKGGFDRSRTRGLAIFACSAENLWRVIELPMAVQSQLVINHFPAVGQLESVVQEREAIGVLLADRQRARFFVFEMGDLVEHSELLDELPRAYDERGERERGSVDHHVEELAHQHLRHAAKVAWQVWQATPFHHLAVGAADPIARQLEHELHPYLRDRVCGRVHLQISANHADVLAAAETVELEVERRKEAALVDRLREAVATRGRGVAGLKHTLAALNEHRVDRLLVSHGYHAPGWHCPSTGELAVVGPTSPLTGERMDVVEDVVEEAVEVALNRGIPVEVCVGNADLDVIGQIGALLRY